MLAPLAAVLMLAVAGVAWLALVLAYTGRFSRPARQAIGALIV